MDLPCIECLVLAKCMTKQDEVRCSILYKYFENGGIKNKHENGSDYYTHPQTDRIAEITTFFNKKRLRWFVNYEDLEVYPGPNAPELILHWDKRKEQNEN